jgi:hypothetical protein
MTSTLDHSATSAIFKYSFNSLSITLSRQENLEIDIKHMCVCIYFTSVSTIMLLCTFSGSVLYFAFHSITYYMLFSYQTGYIM